MINIIKKLFTKRKTNLSDYPDMQAVIEQATSNPDRFTEVGLYVLASDEWTVTFYNFDEGIGHLCGFSRPLTTVEVLALSREADDCAVHFREV